MSYSDDCGSGEEFVVDVESLRVEANEDDGIYAAGIDVKSDCVDGDAGCTIRWKRVDAGADGGKCDGADLMLAGEFKTAAVAACEEIVFIAVASMPDGADGVEDPFGRESETGSGLGVAGGAALKFAAGSKKFGAGGAMNGSIDAATAEERGIRGVHDRVNSLCCDVILDCDQLGHANLRFDDTPRDLDGWPASFVRA